MSSQPRPGQKGPAGKPGAPGKPGPAPERKAPGTKGPVVTPQVLGIIVALILIIGGVAYWQTVVVKFNTRRQELTSQMASYETNIKTYKTKIAKLPAATEVNLALREKLGTLDHLFLQDQSSIIPFFETELLPILDSSRLNGWVVKVQEYTFEINMAMSPFTTLPSHYVEEPQDIFKMKYFGEQNGKAPEGPRDTRPTSFLKGYSVSFEECIGTYEDVQEFIKDIQQNNKIKLITIHCIKNDEGENVRFFRTSSKWNIQATIYFMNPEAAATGNDPPDPPGSKTCS